MSHYIQANTNGRLHPASEPSISPLNRGFLYGDAIYEVWRTYHGVVFAWDEHWKRLENSAAALSMPLGFSQEQILAEIRRTTEAFFAATGMRGIELYVRLQLTLGSPVIGLDAAVPEKPEFVLLVQPLKKLTPEILRDGVRLSLATRLHRNPANSLNPAWKTGNYLNNILCLREAKARGAHEVVITNLKGELTEASVCNIGFFREDSFVTPPLEAGILGGITRGLVLSKIAKAAGFAAVEETVRPEDLGKFTECCLLSTTVDLTPVNTIDGVHFHVGADSRVLWMKAAFAKYASAYAEARQELKIA